VRCLQLPSIQSAGYWDPLPWARQDIAETHAYICGLQRLARAAGEAALQMTGRELCELLGRAEMGLRAALDNLPEALEPAPSIMLA
jgi:hypothetical protein